MCETRNELSKDRQIDRVIEQTSKRVSERMNECMKVNKRARFRFSAHQFQFIYSCNILFG